MFKIIIIACIIGAAIGFLTNKNPLSGAMNGAMKGGCFAVGCIWRVLIGILLFGFITWLLCLLIIG